MASNPLVLGIPLQKQVTRHNIHSVYCTLVCLHLHVQDLHQIRRCIFRDKKKYSQFIVIVASSIRQTNHYTDCHNLEQNSVIVCVCVYIYIYPRKWVPVNTAWRVLRLRMEDGPLIWRVAVNILNKRLRTADKVWSSSLRVGRGVDKSSPY